MVGTGVEGGWETAACPENWKQKVAAQKQSRTILKHGHGCVPIKPAGLFAGPCYAWHIDTQHVAKPQEHKNMHGKFKTLNSR